MIQEVCHLANKEGGAENTCHIKSALTAYTNPDVIAFVRSSLLDEKANAADPKTCRSKGSKRRSHLQNGASRLKTGSTGTSDLLRKQRRLSKHQPAELPAKKSGHLQFKEDALHVERLENLVRVLPGENSPHQVARHLFRIGLLVMELLEAGKAVRA